jgi:hypothetical protein
MSVPLESLRRNSWRCSGAKMTSSLNLPFLTMYGSFPARAFPASESSLLGSSGVLAAAE